MVPPPDTLRARLEDRADLLEATRLRYRALEKLLRAFFWKDRVRANLELLREVALAQPEVDATLESVARRAEAEGWPKDSAPMALLSEVERLREAVAWEVERRLIAKKKPELLGDALLKLEEEVLDAGPLLGRRLWAQAVEILPRNLPELRAACVAAEVFERVFKRPTQAGALPFNAAEADEVRRALPVAETALEALWARLDRFDATGRVRAFLEKRARRAPVHPPRSGPELLLHADFWHGLARARLKALLEERLSPVVPREQEWPELLGWLVAREVSAQARLPASEVLSEGRAGLLEVAAELAALSHVRPLGAWNEEAAWVRLWTAAQRARAETGPDLERLRESLRLFIRLRGQGQTPARLFSEAQGQLPRLPSGHVGDEVDDLPGLVQRAREAAGRPRAGRMSG
ncbi:GLTP domain-containing protein [Archangium minus]|uniref:GLTP domain-containing protein n=1 Tax=Archangium minus TaxID=83450 RepID=A0ABY9WK65_9BACT|nr:GLTP domain-containing protein [Archangium minus]